MIKEIIKQEKLKRILIYRRPNQRITTKAQRPGKIRQFTSKEILNYSNAKKSPFKYYMN